jgi:hypothetical protein
MEVFPKIRRLLKKLPLRYTVFATPPGYSLRREKTGEPISKAKDS